MITACEGSLLGSAAGPSGAPGSSGSGSGSGPGGGVMGPAVCESDSLLVGSAPMRRLANAEYLHTLRDLFPGVTVALPELPPDTDTGGFENDALSLGASDVRVARWEEIAWRYGSAITATPASLSTFLPCAASATDETTEQACGQELVRDFGLRAMRRPLASDERDRYLALFEAQRVAIDFEGAVQLTVMAMLQAPSFLYRIEVPSVDSQSGARDAAIAALDSYQVATRLSYFLWESTPDDALLDAAGAGELETPEQIEAQARRMLEDGRAREAVVDFHRQWLDFDRILEEEHARRVPELFPGWNEDLRNAVREEQDRFVESTIFDDEGTLTALLTSNRTWVNGELAQLYGVAGPSDGSTWTQTELPAAERAGLLTRAGFLASHSHSANGSPPLRGVFITERLLCEPRPSPPASANTSPPTAEPGAGPRTNRQLFEERTAAPVCQGCHVRMDGMGFGFENYDAIGAFRELDDGLPVDSSGNVLGTDVDGPYVGGVELSGILAESERVQECATRQWVRYALGRAPEREDACLIDRLADRFAESDGNVRDLLVAIVTSPEFRHRPAAQE